MHELALYIVYLLVIYSMCTCAFYAGYNNGSWECVHHAQGMLSRIILCVCMVMTCTPHMCNVCTHSHTLHAHYTYTHAHYTHSRTLHAHTTHTLMHTTHTHSLTHAHTHSRTLQRVHYTRTHSGSHYTHTHYTHTTLHAHTTHTLIVGADESSTIHFGHPPPHSSQSPALRLPSCCPAATYSYWDQTFWN